MVDFEQPDDLDVRITSLARVELEDFALELAVAVFGGMPKQQFRVLRDWGMVDDSGEQGGDQ